MANPLRRLIDLVDRNVVRWRGDAVVTLIVACLPMLLYAIATGKRPADASTPLFAAMLLLPVLLGSLAFLRSVRYLWREHKRIQALGIAEDEGRSPPR